MPAIQLKRRYWKAISVRKVMPRGGAGKRSAEIELWQRCRRLPSRRGFIAGFAMWQCKRCSLRTRSDSQITLSGSVKSIGFLRKSKLWQKMQRRPSSMAARRLFKLRNMGTYGLATFLGLGVALLLSIGQERGLTVLRFSILLSLRYRLVHHVPLFAAKSLE